MDQLPVEIHSKILGLACVDDNSTGRSLALTCKWLGDIANLVRFEAVSLCGTSTVVQFAAMLDGLPNHAAATSGKINHLFVSDLSRKEAEEAGVRMNLRMRKLAIARKLIASDDNGDTYDDDYDKIDLKSYKERMGLMHERAKLFYGAFHRVLHHTSQSLRTLFIIATLQCAEDLPPFPMPNLTDFSTTIAYSSFASSSTYPNLKRINIDFDPCLTNHKPINFRNCTPALEELRITDLRASISSNNTANLLAALAAYDIRCMELGARNVGHNIIFPDSMKVVFIQPCSPPYGARCSNPRRTYISFNHNLILTAKQFAESENRHAGLRVVILPAPDVYSWVKGKSSGLHYSFEDAKRDWTNVLLGDGKGCWDDVDQEDLRG